LIGGATHHEPKVMVPVRERVSGPFAAWSSAATPRHERLQHRCRTETVTLPRHAPRAAEEEAGQSGRRRRRLERPQRWRGGNSRPAAFAPRHRSACGMEQRVKCEPRPTSALQPDDQSRSENTFVF